MEIMDNEMDRILQQVGLSSCICSFRRENISPNIVCKLSMYELKQLGVTGSSDMMKLRIECIKYGQVVHLQSRVEPKYDISKETIEFLIDSGFRINEISKLLSVSERTIYRRMSTYGLSVYNFTNIDDEALRGEVGKVTMEFPRIGETMIRQVLHERGIKIPRWRLREVIHDIDQVGISDRMRGGLHRRVYNVTAPNHLWHIDTNHKLIRWHFIICGGIDGLSRFIVFF